ncbi:MAG: glutamyl-tRNA reductase, partial [Nitrospirales bacterium]|nr:glutamyl-tRNA reductase [Nitrospirales bacterium]
APIEVREKFAIPPEKLGDFLRLGTQRPHVEELVVVSTCNRVELYGASRHPRQASQQLLKLLGEFQEEDIDLLEPHHYFHEGEEAVQQGFCVASSLDSMILGETQILGQVKEAYRQGLDAGSTGRLLNKYFHHAFSVAKRVRTETKIAAHPVSVSYAAVVLAKQIFGDLKSHKALILGTGKMNRIALKHLKSSGIQQFFMANRSHDKALELVEEFGGEVIPFENFTQWLGDVDVVLTSTSAPHYLIHADMVEEALKKRKNNPIFFIDLAVPRDVSPDINQMGNVFLYDVDDLGAVVSANKDVRTREAEKAMAIVEKETKKFGRVLRTFEVVPTISSLSLKFEKICQSEVEKALQRLPELQGEGREVIEGMATAIIKKVLHDPMVTLKEDATSEDPLDYVALVRKLFRLDEAK